VKNNSPGAAAEEFPLGIAVAARTGAAAAHTAVVADHKAARTAGAAAGYIVEAAAGRIDSAGHTDHIPRIVDPGAEAEDMGSGLGPVEEDTSLVERGEAEGMCSGD
jgi:hypothetical protein